MPLPIVIVVGGIGLGAYVIGRFFKKGREQDLENHLNISEAMRAKDQAEHERAKKRTFKEIMEDILDK